MWVRMNYFCDFLIKYLIRKIIPTNTAMTPINNIAIIIIGQMPNF